MTVLRWFDVRDHGGYTPMAILDGNHLRVDDQVNDEERS